MPKGKFPKEKAVGYGTNENNESDVIIEAPSTDKAKKSVIPAEYTKGIQKIASYSGVTRVMKCGGNSCGGFDEIVNIYVYPDGEVTYPRPKNNSTTIDRTMEDHSISKQGVRDYGHKELSIWGKKEILEGVHSRRKKASKPVRRMTVPKRGNAKKRK